MPLIRAARQRERMPAGENCECEIEIWIESHGGWSETGRVGSWSETCEWTERQGIEGSS